MKIWAFALAAGVCCALNAAENLVKNGDFSAGNRDWRSPQYTGGKPFHTFADGKLLVSGNPAAKNNGFAALIQGLPKLDVGQTYLLVATVDAKVADPAKKAMWIKVRQVLDNKQTLRYDGIDVSLKTPGPRQYTARFRPSEKAAGFVFYITAANLADDDVVTVSNVRLVPITLPPPVPGNLAQNGDFSAPTLKPWWVNARPAKTAPFSVETDPETGIATLKVCGDPKNKQKAFLTLVQNLPELQQGKRYRISAKVKAGIAAARGKSVGVLVREVQGANQSLGYQGISVPLAREGWMELGRDFTPNAKAVKHQLYITNCNLAEGDTVLIRDVTLTPVE